MLFFEAEHGGEFLVVYYSIRNNSKETTTGHDRSV